LAKIELYPQANQQIESNGEKNQELNDKAKTALKAETKRKLSAPMEPEKNITPTRFIPFGF
jgi:hypothetical protein